MKSWSLKLVPSAANEVTSLRDALIEILEHAAFAL